MYHLVYRNRNGFIVINDVTYACSSWRDCVPTVEDYNKRGDSHWNKTCNKGKPISEALGFNDVLLVSSTAPDFSRANLKKDYPELFL